MAILSKIKKGFQQIEGALQFIFKMLFTKKALLASLLVMMFLRIKYFPTELSTSAFLRLLQGSDIRYLISLGNRIILFTNKSNQNFLCNYYVQDSEKFNNTLM